LDTGKAIRLSRIFRVDGKTVIAALDHGISGIASLSALERPAELIAELIDAGVDAILTTTGILQICPQMIGRTGVILRIDGGPTSLTGEWEKERVILGVEDALRLGVDAVIMMGIVGDKGEADSLIGLGKAAAECQRWGLPLIAEMLPGGLTAGEASIQQVQIAARLGAELGADLIKIRYQGPREAYRPVIDSCYKPLVILGGSRQAPETLMSEIRDAISIGACGVAVGRNIWQSPQPGEIARRLVEVVHVQ
jgi:DhnA family fructose-bisphosphate aldolase class Ia